PFVTVRAHHQDDLAPLLRPSRDGPTRSAFGVIRMRGHHQNRCHLLHQCLLLSALCNLTLRQDMPLYSATASHHEQERDTIHRPVMGAWSMGHIIVEESQHTGQVALIRGIIRGPGACGEAAAGDAAAMRDLKPGAFFPTIATHVCTALDEHDTPSPPTDSYGMLRKL